MFMEPAVLNEFAIGAAAGLGHSLGTRVLNWISVSWSRWSRGGVPGELPLLRRVQLKDLRGGIPAGTQLCRYQGDQLLEATTVDVPSRVAEGETLWLVPIGEVWLPTELTQGNEVAEAEVAVEFDPALGLHRLLEQGDGVPAALVGALVSGGLMGVLNAPGWGRWSELLAGDTNTAAQCLAQLNRSVEGRGLRCKALRQVKARTQATTDSEATATHVELTQAIDSLQTPQAWAAVPQSLAQAGLPLDTTAEAELRAMQQAVLQKQLSPEQAANRLAALTAAAIERAGINVPDLSTWRTSARKLDDDAPVEPASTPSAAVDAVRRPGTWWVWDRTEVDRRLQRFLRRVSQHCRSGLDQAMLTVPELPVLRKLRDLQTQITMLDELLATLPTAEPRTRGLRLDGPHVKEAARALQTAVTQAEKLRTSIDTLLRTPTDQPNWTTTWSESSQSATILSQHLRDRRILR